MRIMKKQLKQIIKEELSEVLSGYDFLGKKGDSVSSRYRSRMRKKAKFDPSLGGALDKLDINDPKQAVSLAQDLGSEEQDYLDLESGWVKNVVWPSIKVITEDSLLSYATKNSEATKTIDFATGTSWLSIDISMPMAINKILDHIDTYWTEKIRHGKAPFSMNEFGDFWDAEEKNIRKVIKNKIIELIEKGDYMADEDQDLWIKED